MTKAEQPTITQADRDRAFNTGIRLSKREWLEVYAAFARHRIAAENRTTSLAAQDGLTDFDPALCPSCRKEDFDGCDDCGNCSTCCKCGAQDGLVEALARQADNMAFVINHMDLPPQWYEKFTKELEEDRQALVAIKGDKS